MSFYTYRTLVLTLFVTIFSSLNVEANTPYRSEVDDKLTVRTISLLPIFDNLQGIYARPVEKHLVSKLSNNHRFEFSSADYAGPITTPEQIEDDPKLLEQVMTGTKSDAVIAGRVTKGPQGISFHFSMFLASDKKLFAKADVKGFKALDTKSVQREAHKLIQKLFKKLPYEGIVLSRQGTRVTLNLGRNDGIDNGKMLSVIQIIKAERHPKFGFIVNTEKEILGKIKVIKADKTLSFGRIISEKEKGAILIGSKVSGLDSVVYGDSNTWSAETPEEKDLKNRPDNQISFGNNPKEWLPKRKPTFGAVGARLGMGSYTENMTTSSDSLDTKSPFYPFITIEGEVWFTPNWTIHANLRQGIMTTENPKAGGAPSELSHSLSSYELMFGYNFRMGVGLFAPNVELLGGFANYRLFVDQSTPVGLTTKTYSGPKFGVSGIYPLSDKRKWAIGAELFFFYDPDLNESPSVSGNGDHDIKQFGLFADQRINLNLKARYSLDFEMYSSDFSSGSSSQKYTNLGAGLFYMF